MKQQSIKSLVEIIDSEQDYEEALRIRLKTIKQFSSLGPPDLCYLTKQFKVPIISIGQKQTKIGCYHFVQGLNASTPACISAYINSLISQQEQDNTKWFSNGEWIITKGYYCIFDAFTRIDIHIEISIPGQMKLYGFTSDNSIITVNDKLWEKAYVSTILRAMQPINVPTGKIFEIFRKKTELEEFLKIFFEIIKDNDLQLDESEDLYIFKFNGSKALSIVTEYLFQNKTFFTAFEHLNSNMPNNPKCIIPLTILYKNLDRFIDAMKINAFYLLKYPTAATLLYIQSQCLLQKEKFQESYTLAKILCTQLPHNFDSWFLLGEIFTAVKNYSLALVAFNIASEYVRPNKNTNKLEQDQLASYIVNKDRTQPKQIGDSDSFVSFNINPEPLQIEYLKQNSENPQKEESYITSDVNEKHYLELTQLPGNTLGQDESLIYNKLVDIIRDITWEALIKKRGQIFILDSESNKFNLEYQLENDFPNLLIKEQKEQQLIQFKKQQSQNQKDSQNQSNAPNIVEIEEDDYSDGGENDLPLFLKDNVTQQKFFQNNQMKEQLNNNKNNHKNKKNINSKQQVQQKQKQFNQQQSGSGNSNQNKWESSKINHITEKTEDSIESERKQKFQHKSKQKNQNQQQNIQQEPSSSNNLTRDIFKLKLNEEIPISKRLCGKNLDLIFESIYQDMNYMQKWNNESKMINDKSKIQNQQVNDNFQAQTWLLRAILSDRLKYHELAIKSYQQVIEKSYCMYAWHQLIKKYIEFKNYRAAFQSIQNVIIELEILGMKYMQYLPKWISKEIFNIISKIGIQNLFHMVQDLQIQNDSITRCINQAIDFKVIGTNDYKIEKQ